MSFKRYEEEVRTCEISTALGLTSETFTALLEAAEVLTIFAIGAGRVITCLFICEASWLTAPFSE